MVQMTTRKINLPPAKDDHKKITKLGNCELHANNDVNKVPTQNSIKVLEKALKEKTFSDLKFDGSENK